MQSVANHPLLDTLRLTNRRTQEYHGACPFCGGDDHRSDRFIVWMTPGHEHYWCRQCNAKGALWKLIGRSSPLPKRQPAMRSTRKRRIAEPTTEHHGDYRKLYQLVALWAAQRLWDECDPEPLTYLRGRGFSDERIRNALFGSLPRDPQALVTYLRDEYSELFPFALEAGITWMRDDGKEETHPNLRGVIVLPYIAEGEITDIRTRAYAGKGYRSLAGGYTERGAVYPFGWDEMSGDVIVITEGEFKATMVNQCAAEGSLNVTAIAHPGLSYFREEWASALVDRGVQTVILAYDSQPRATVDGLTALTPEEQWTLKHGRVLAAAGLTVRVVRLPLAKDEVKSDLDGFLLARGATALQRIIATSPTLDTYHASIPRALLEAAKIPPAPLSSFPLHRKRPRQLSHTAAIPATTTPVVSLAHARESIGTIVREHVESGEGIVVLAHPPGTGKGYNTVRSLADWQHAQSTPSSVVWVAPRKNQVGDQDGMDFTVLHGRNPSNCMNCPIASVLSDKGYRVSSTLCHRRCAYIDNCAYLRQFSQDGNKFAAFPLLNATPWWKDAGVLVLDEFDPTQLATIVRLDTADLAHIQRGTQSRYVHAVLRWIVAVIGHTMDSTLRGGLWYDALAAAACAEDCDLTETLVSAEDDLSVADIDGSLAVPIGATIADYEALPPNYAKDIVGVMLREYRRHMRGEVFTSRISVGHGRITLYLRNAALLRQLADSSQRKIILDATPHEGLLRALFPQTPIRIEQPSITSPARVIQIVNNDWAKSGLHGERRTRWHRAIIQRIRTDTPTLIVCTMQEEAGVRAALQQRGFTDYGASPVVVSHYGALRGANAYKGYDVILAQIYNPNLQGIVDIGRSLFADDPEPLDERVVDMDTINADQCGALWAINGTTFADQRLAALLESKRESEMVQAALRGRPFDHPDVQITLMFALPLPGLPVTQIMESESSALSNGGRSETAKEKLVYATTRLLAMSHRVLSVAMIAEEARVSVGTVRKHWDYIAAHLQLRRVIERRTREHRVYSRMVLMRRGRSVAAENTIGSMDHAHKIAPVMSAICASRVRRRVLLFHTVNQGLQIPNPPLKQSGTRSQRMILTHKRL